jgi:phenylalanyl-tRNA synthetase beta subunit
MANKLYQWRIGLSEGRAAIARLDDRVLGVLGEISCEIATLFGVPKDVLSV